MSLAEPKISLTLRALAMSAAGALMLAGCTVPSEVQQTTPPVQTRVPISSPPGGALGESTIADLAQEAMKSVVNIDTTTNVAVQDYATRMPFNLFGDEPLMPHIQQYQMRGTGSGVIIRKDGYILTNNHVAGNASTIKVTLNDKRVFTGKIVGRDGFTDLAVVKIPADGLPVARLGTAKQLRPGDFAVAIGSPAGLSNTVTMGIISALGRSLGDQLGDVGLVQTDAAINPGNSGGPLLNIHGEVIGVNTAIQKNFQNIGFAIPIDIAKQVSDQLIKSGAVKHPFVGIAMRDLDDDIDKKLGLDVGTRGVLVAQVNPGSPAFDAGIQKMDIITKVDGIAVSNAKQIQGIVRTHLPGDNLSLTVTRDGQPSTFNLTIGDYPAGTGNGNQGEVP